jgi:uncharacterized protein
MSRAHAMPESRICWIVSDGAAGNEKQALALASGLGLRPSVLRIGLKAPWRWLAPRYAPVPGAAAFLPRLPEPFPDIAIGAGRIGAVALLSLKKLSREATRTVQILDPRVDPARFDLVIAPRHDRLAGPNVITIDGALHTIDADWLARARAYGPQPGAPASPRSLLLIGGPRRGVPLDAGLLASAISTLADWQTRQGGSLVVIGSRRTPPAWRTAVRTALPAGASCWFTEADGPNPYAAALAWADCLIVSADSVNMLSEALGTGQPVYLLAGGPARGKLGRFHEALIASGRVRPLKAGPADWSYPPLRELERIAPEVRQRLAMPA